MAVCLFGLLCITAFIAIRYHESALETSGEKGFRVASRAIAHFEAEVATSWDVLVEALPLLGHCEIRYPNPEEWEAIHRDRDPLRMLWRRHRGNLERLRWNYRGIIHTYGGTKGKLQNDWIHRIMEIGEEIDLLDWYGGRLGLERDPATEAMNEYQDQLLYEDTEHRRLYLEFLERQAELERKFAEEER